MWGLLVRPHRIDLHPLSGRHARSLDRHAASHVPDPERKPGGDLADPLHDRPVPASQLVVMSSAPAAVSQPTLEVREVTKLYGGLRAVADVNFSVAPGEV